MRCNYLFLGETRGIFFTRLVSLCALMGLISLIWSVKLGKCSKLYFGQTCICCFLKKGFLRIVELAEFNTRNVSENFISAI